MNESYFLAQDISYEYQDIKQVQASAVYNPESLREQARQIKKIKEEIEQS